jgi:SAM-dependent methyltransferase
VSTTAEKLRLLLRPWVIPSKIPGFTVALLRHWHILPPPKLVFPESALAHHYLDGLSGIEIGGSAHNPFGLDTVQVDNPARGRYEDSQKSMCGEVLPVDVEAEGDALPFPDSSADFVLSSHVLEHFPDPIKALEEWHRVTKPDGFIFVIVPHKDRTFDIERPRTTLSELIARHQGAPATEDPYGHGHFNVWTADDIIELLSYLSQEFELVELRDPDDKVGNGFAVVLRVKKCTED